jgi:hypothetical protein
MFEHTSGVVEPQWEQVLTVLGVFLNCVLQVLFDKLLTLGSELYQTAHNSPDSSHQAVLEVHLRSQL